MAIKINSTTVIDDSRNFSAGSIAYTTTLTGGTGVVNLGSGQVYKDASGNVGIGTSSPLTALDVVNAANGIIQVRGGSSTNQGGSFFVKDSANYNTLAAFGDRARALGGTPDQTVSIFTGNLPLTFDVNATERMRITSSGNVGLGVSNPGSFLSFGTKINNTDTASHIRLFDGGGINGNNYGFGVNIDGLVSYTSGLGTGHAFYTGNVERMRILNTGAVMVGTTSADFASSPGIKFSPDAAAAGVAIVHNSATNNGSYHLYNTNATNNGYRFYVTTNGGIFNFSGNNVNLSDERSKKNIEVSDNYLNKICAIPVKLFNYKDEPEGQQRTLGVIAQDVEIVAPEFVNNDGVEGTNPENGVPLKTIYTTDLMFGLMKAIQELSAKVDTLQAEINTLKGN